jgi:hypothetical protein
LEQKTDDELIAVLIDLLKNKYPYITLEAEEEINKMVEAEKIK